MLSELLSEARIGDPVEAALFHRRIDHVDESRRTDEDSRTKLNRFLKFVWCMNVNPPPPLAWGAYLGPGMGPNV